MARREVATENDIIISKSQVTNCHWKERIGRGDERLSE